MHNRKNINFIKDKVAESEKIVCLTAYNAPIAKIIDKYCDIILVGDSLATVLYGMPNTLSATLDMMIMHGKTVVNSTEQSLVTIDMPFGSYEESPEFAFKNAAQILKMTGCNAVKLEGGQEFAKTIKFLTTRGIPVMGHIGLMPQNLNIYGKYTVQGGNNSQEAEKIIDDAYALEEAGAFAIVIECCKREICDKIIENINIPIIGIGASPNCHGQILVTEDLIGFFQAEKPPKFLKQYANIAEIIEKSVEEYADDVKNTKFPTDKHCYM